MITQNQTSNMSSQIIFIQPLLLSIFFLSAHSDPRATPAGNLTCSGDRATSPNFIPTFVQAMERLSSNLNGSSNNFAITNITDPSQSPFYALIQCHRDLSRTDCLVCYAVSRTAVPGCLPRTSGRIFLDGCFVRYDNNSFFQQAVDPATDTRNCTSSLVTNNWDDFQGGFMEFNRSVGELVENVSRLAVNNSGFGVLGLNRVYGLAQCWESLTNDECRTCLDKAKAEAVGCLPSREGRSMNAGCYLRYSTHKFFNNDSQADGGSSGLSSPGAKVAVVLAAVAFLMISSFAGYAAYIRISKIREERKNMGMLSNSFNKSGLKYKYETLEKATNYFDLSNKLGQGGAGSVYKGTLPNGDVVAVKRLFFNTRQWVDEFFNEVNLISAIEHKNLVKLLACSIEGPESLLVYEYVPNKSLDHFLFDKDKVQVLTWRQRMAVILGTAEGLVYLHGGCHVRIIHRDIKSSNILLDKDFNPKIADFGLVRTFGADRSHLTTGIAGTLGYMAPEYIVRGQLTEKADVFSFGVVVLEIACGKRNNAFVEDTGSLLQSVWKLYKEGVVTEAIDPLLNGEFPEHEALEVMQIGLLCTQASAALRPSMAEVVEFLTTKAEDRVTPMPVPNQPPFLNARSLMNNQGISSSSTSSPLTKIGLSFTNTSRSSTTPSSEWPLRIDELSSS
ncbi:cysteine-rich receptor-like protein kinase 42 [Bidens hawaiensis]|uniref:cysteine-rich receptor-like protein kinase 42 n=1 Tax=Bidens hawaiensis TaxID=980011 RepID=UPI004049DA53